MRRIILISMLGGLILTMTSQGALALNRWVTIINSTGFTIVQFYGSNKGTNSWQEDILGNRVLGSGNSVDINFDDGTGYCIFDFKAVFDDGDVLVKNGVNICEIGSFTYR